MQKILKYILGSLPIIVLIVLVLPFLGIIEQKIIYDFFSTYVNPKIGVNPFLAAFVTLILVYVFYRFSGDIFSLNPEKRKRFTLIYFSVFAIYFLWGWVQSNKDIERICPTIDTPFFIAGEPVIFYFKHTDGKLEFFNHSGKHPQIGGDLLPMNKLTALQTLQYIKTGQTNMFIECKSDKPLSGESSNILKRICPTQDFVFFDSNGNSKVNFHTYDDGKIELFESNLQFHPQLGVPLNPVNSKIAKRIITYLSSGQESFIIGCNTNISGQSVENLNNSKTQIKSSHSDKKDTLIRNMNKNINSKSNLEELSNALK